MYFARTSTLLLLTVVALVAGHKTASAQGFFGGFGGGDDHHHHDAAGHRTDDAGHHIDNHGNHTGSWGVFDGDHSHEHYNSQNSYNTYSVPRTTYYSPSQSTSIAPNSLPRPSDPIAVGGPIEITFPAGQQGSVNYALNNHQYKIQTGEAQVIPSDRSWTIVFDRGGSAGTARYSLTPGTYVFSVEEKGWELRKKKRPQPELAADAPAPPAPAPAPLAPAPAVAAATPNSPPPTAAAVTVAKPVDDTSVIAPPAAAPAAPALVTGDK